MPVGCKNKNINLTNFINKANIIHNNKYDYSKFEWIFSKENSIIICPIHGEFLKSPVNHIKGQGCPDCKKLENKKDNYEKSKKRFFELAKEIHGDLYNYEKTNYINSSTKVTIICSIHGEFSMTPNRHTSGQQGCPNCAAINRIKNNTLSTEDFINKAKAIHGDIYDYSITNYINGKSEVDIVCRIHGKFTIKNAKKHISAERKQGCPHCKGIISNGEKIIMEYLNNKNISYFYNSILTKKDDYLKNKPFDFILNDYKTIIEFDGSQHFEKKFNMNDKDLELRKIIDETKDKLANFYGYKVFRIKYTDNIIESLNNYFSSTTIETTL